MQQRAIRPDVVSIVLDYGDEFRARGASVRFITTACRKRICEDIGTQAFKRLADQLDVLVVVGDDGKVVTVSHRTRRIKSGAARRGNLDCLPRAPRLSH